MTTTAVDPRTRHVRIAGPDDAPLTVIIKRLDRPRWSELVAAHPPRQGTSDRLWNEVSFPPALIAASTGLTVDETRAWWEDTPELDGNDLYEACLRLSSPGTVEWAVRRLKGNSRLMAEVQASMRAGISHAQFLEWPDDSQDLAIALSIVENDRCPGGCGASRTEMQNPLAFTVGTTRCVWCQQLEVEREKIRAEDRGHRHVILLPKG